MYVTVTCCVKCILPVGRKQFTAAQSSSSSTEDIEEELLSFAAATRPDAALAPPRVDPEQVNSIITLMITTA